MEIKTIDDLIETAQKFKEKYGGDCPVGCWPYDGQELHARYIGSLELVEFIDEPVVVNHKIKKYPPYGHESVVEKMSFVMIEHYSKF